MTHIRQSRFVLVCCVLFGTLIIGGSSIVISGLPWLFLLIAIWYFAISPEPEKVSDLVAGIYLKLIHSTESEENKTFKIDKVGFFESEITHSSVEQEKTKNSKLLSTTFQSKIEKKTRN